MKRDERLRMLSWDHHHGLVMALRIERELPAADEEALSALYSDLIAFWSAGLLPHFRVEGECLLARLVRHLPAGHESVARTLHDHLALESLVMTMREAAGAPERREALASFGASLREHIRWEESVLFDVTQSMLESAEMDGLAADIARYLPDLVAAPVRAERVANE